MNLALLIPLDILFTLGNVVLYSIMRNQKAPADTSNRINKIRLIFSVLKQDDLVKRVATRGGWDLTKKRRNKWRALKLAVLHEEYYATHFEELSWLRNDERDNLK